MACNTFYGLKRLPKMMKDFSAIFTKNRVPGVKKYGKHYSTRYGRVLFEQSLCSTSEHFLWFSKFSQKEERKAKAKISKLHRGQKRPRKVSKEAGWGKLFFINGHPSCPLFRFMFNLQIVSVREPNLEHQISIFPPSTKSRVPNILFAKRQI
jgi:hypothetical protein